MEPHPRGPILRDLVRALILAALAAGVGIAVNYPFVLAAWRGEKRLTLEEKRSEVLEVAPEISLAEAHALFEDGQALFLDARSSEDYASGHIPGALSLPWEEFGRSFPRVRSRLRPGHPIVTYCDGEGCELSIHLADTLLALGYGPVRVYYGGWPEWQEAGYPQEPREE